MDARFRLVRDLFGKSKAKFEVPAYQRGFEWSKDEFNDLWLDLNRIGGQVEKHFLGNIILLKEGTYSDEYEIVDGQQRMTTISILTIAIRDSDNFEGDEGDNRIDTILNRLKGGSKTHRRLYLYDDDADSSYNSLWNGNHDEAVENIREGYDFYKQKLSELDHDEIEEILEKLFNDLSVVETTVDDPALAYPIFQTQNARGKEVSPIVLAKSRIHGAARKLDDERDKKRITHRWEKVYDKLKENLSGPRFRREDIRVRRPMAHILANSPIDTQTRIKKADLYENFERVLNSYDDVDEFVGWFEENVDTLLYDLSSSKLDVNARNFNNEIRRQLQYLNASSNHSEVLSLAIYKKYEQEFDIKESRTERLLKNDFNLAATIGMRMRLGSADHNAIRDAIYSAASEVKNVTDHTEIREILRSTVDTYTPSDPEIEENLVANSVSAGNRFQFRTVLYLMSLEESRRNDPFWIDLNKLHVEHITPRNTFEDGRYARWQPNHSKEEFNDRKNKIGNLTLLLPNEHNKISETDGFDAKKRTYKESSMEITQQLCDYSEWDDDKIDERSRMLARQLTDYWSVR